MLLEYGLVTSNIDNVPQDLFGPIVFWTWQIMNAQNVWHATC